MNLLPECLIADGAGEGADVLVHPHVRRQIVGLFKDLATDLAVLEHPLAGPIVAIFEWAGGGHSVFGLLGQMCISVFVTVVSCLLKTNAT